MQKKDDMTSERLYRKGNEFWFDGKPERALEFYRQAVDAMTEDTPLSHQVEVLGAKALSLCQTDDFAAALAIYLSLHDLCRQAELDDTTVLRQWAKALEESGDLIEARRLYETNPPDDRTHPLDSLKWHHAYGLLNWREGRLAEARDNLAAATALMPDDPGAAAEVLAVLGNDALLSLDLDDIPRAMRLADRMIGIRATADGIPLSSEINLFRVRAALAGRRQDHDAQLAIFREGLAFLEQNAADAWMRRLDLATDLAAASVDTPAQKAALAELNTLCNAAPEELSWIGRFTRAHLHISAGATGPARDDLGLVLSSFAGAGSAAAGEVEIVMQLARLCDRQGNRMAAVLLGKLSLKYLAEIALTLEGQQLQKILKYGDEVTGKTVKHLQALGRFEEAQLLAQVLERVQRHTLLLRTSSGQPQPDPVPLDSAERQAEDRWLAARQQLANLRNAGDLAGARQLADRVLDDLAIFENTSGLDRQPAASARPTGRNLRLSLLPAGDHCIVWYHWQDRSESHRIDVPAQIFITLVAELREAAQDNHAWRDPAARLNRHLITPIEAELDRLACVEVDASGILGRIPFALLADGGPCLAQRVPVKYIIDATPPATPAPPRQGLLHCAAFDSGPLAAQPGFVTDPPAPLQPASFLPARSFTRAALLEGLQARPACLSIAAHFDAVPSRADLRAISMGADEPLYLSDLGGAHFDLQGMRIALLAACSSGLDDVTESSRRSLAALALEKGVQSFVGTLWDISESAAARFTAEFWATCDPRQDPATILAGIQAGHAQRAPAKTLQTSTGGIGHQAGGITPADWAAFAVYETCNPAQ